MKMRNIFKSAIKILTIVVAISIFCKIFLGLRIIPSSSMLPTIQMQDIIVADKVLYKIYGIKRGDIVLFHPLEPGSSTDEEWIKRVVGLPGETVEIKDGEIYIDNRKLVQNYSFVKPGYSMGSYKIPEHSYFVLGDNRNNSIDSHSWGALPNDNIVGRALFVIWPEIKSLMN